MIPLVYADLRRIAAAQMRREAAGRSLQPTALVHEAYIRLVDSSRIRLRNRAHFFALAARVMRQILCNYARDRRALKRGGGIGRLTLDDGAALPAPASPDRAPADALVALDDALKRLEGVDARQSKVVDAASSAASPSRRRRRRSVFRRGRSNETGRWRRRGSTAR